ncbi:hypothetical protein QYE76_022301 [Lolium multiflorum]|uniref:CCHC-type domain-containing protein n=1 Tax=Lolium multiflorum TaxID=4521 RepID=A0AAD8RCD7_LOLMU|nr:hypothetical protein QYE76_022301 [Lolium multiflorum]
MWALSFRFSTLPYLVWPNGGPSRASRPKEVQDIGCTVNRWKVVNPRSARQEEFKYGRIGCDEDIPTEPLPLSLQSEEDVAVKLKSNEARIGPMPRARAKLLKQQDEGLTADIEKVTKKLDSTNETVNTIQEQVTDIQRSLQALQLVVENLTNNNMKKGTMFMEIMKNNPLPKGVVLVVVTVVVVLSNSELAVFLHNRKMMVWVSNVSNTKKPEPAASGSGSSMSMARNRDMNCHTCGGKGHFKRDCPNRKVMIINDNDEYETGDDADPDAPEDDDYDSDGVDAFPFEARTIVVSQHALNVQPSASTQRCNLFQIKALVGPHKACKIIIYGGSCRNLASKELCAKLKLKYLPHPHPYYIQWLSDNGEMKVNHMVRVDFEIGPYKNSIDFDVVPMTVCHLLLGRSWLYDRSMQHNGRANTYHLEFKGKKINLQPMSP